MNRRSPSLFVLGLILAPLLFGGPLHAGDEAGADPAAKLAEAKSRRDAVRKEMEAAYLAAETDCRFLRSEEWATERAPYVAAIRSLDETRRGGGAATEEALREAFTVPGHFSDPTTERLAAAVAAAFGKAGEEAVDPEAVLAAAVTAVFPAAEFAACWDQSFQDLPVVVRWRAVNEEIAKLEAAGPAASTPPVEISGDGPPGMVLVPKGSFKFGPFEGWTTDIRSNKEKSEYLQGFYIDVLEVTNAEYLKFLVKHLESSLKRDKPKIPEGWLPTGFKVDEEGNPEMPEGVDRKPVTGICYAAAAAYAKAAGKRLPTEEEWEKAARGEDGRAWPWGAEWNAAFTNHAARGLGGPAPVGTHPEDKSPYGVLDMAGNVAEYTATLSDGKAISRSPKSTDSVVIRGGSYAETADSCRATYRWVHPGTLPGKATIGFRCVISERDFR